MCVCMCVCACVCVCVCVCACVCVCVCVFVCVSVSASVKFTIMYALSEAGACLEREAVMEGGQLQLVRAVVPQLNICDRSRRSHKKPGHKILEFKGQNALKKSSTVNPLYILWTPRGPGEMSCIERCPHFRGEFILSIFGT